MQQSRYLLSFVLIARSSDAACGEGCFAFS
jgi:hypothetical protein